MNRTLQVLLVIAIVLSSVQVCALAVDLLEPQKTSSDPLRGFASQAERRWTVYSLSALGAVVLGFVLRRRYRLAGDAMLIAGVYLMLLANNGGLFSRGHEGYRLATSVLTLAFLLLLAVRGGVSAGADPDA
jgi:hypothetical protein